MKWAYGVTTVPERRDSLLPQTLQSLKEAGFDEPWLFVDGDNNILRYTRYSQNITCHTTRVGALPNWISALWLLWSQHPDCDRYAMFQDDLIAAKGLREYLDGYLDNIHLRANVYWNLYTTQENLDQIPLPEAAKGCSGFYRSNQNGRGAQALVFPREAVRLLLTSHTIRNQIPIQRMNKAGIDKAVINTLSMYGYTELVHNPSLVQHTGKESIIGHSLHRHATSPCFNYQTTL